MANDAYKCEITKTQRVSPEVGRGGSTLVVEPDDPGVTPDAEQVAFPGELPALGGCVGLDRWNGLERLPLGKPVVRVELARGSEGFGVSGMLNSGAIARPGQNLYHCGIPPRSTSSSLKLMSSWSCSLLEAELLAQYASSSL